MSQKRERRELRQRERDLRAMMADAPGRRVAWWLLSELCGLFAPTFTGNSQTFHREGKRQVGIDLMLELQRVDAGAYAVMVRERMDELAAENLQQQAGQAREEQDE